jgi:hypothetical protein
LPAEAEPIRVYVIECISDVVQHQNGLRLVTVAYCNARASCPWATEKHTRSAVDRHTSLALELPVGNSGSHFATGSSTALQRGRRSSAGKDSENPAVFSECRDGDKSGRDGRCPSSNDNLLVTEEQQHPLAEINDYRPGRQLAETVAHFLAVPHSARATGRKRKNFHQVALAPEKWPCPSRKLYSARH